MDSNSLNSLLSFLPIIILVVVFYFLVFRPQQQQRKRHAEMVTSLKRGDKIVTNGGFVCEVMKQEDKFISVRLGDSVVRLSKDYVAYKVDDVAEEQEATNEVTQVEEQSRKGKKSKQENK